MIFAQRAFLWAGVYGVAVLPPQYFLFQKLGRDYPPAINHPEYFYGFVGVALAWQIAFLIIARDPVRYREIMVPGILEKISFGVAAVVLFLQHRVPGLMLAAGIIDLAWAGLFVAAYMRTPRE